MLIKNGYVIDPSQQISAYANLLIEDGKIKKIGKLEAEKEQEVIDQVTQIIEKNTPIPCTGCAYCTHGCPKNIAIPDYFALYNNAARTTVNFSSQFAYYNNISLRHGKAGDCVGCGQCEKACPQHLTIRDFLKNVAEKFEGANMLPTKK